MEFEKKQAVYLQIASYIIRGIAKVKWKEQERLPSVREMSVILRVNPNTVMRSYNYLQAKDIIFNKPGLGYFVSEGVLSRAREIIHRDFVENTLPYIYEMLELMDMSIPDFTQLLAREREGH